MRLAPKSIVITDPPQSFALKPSLRAAFDLAHTYGDFQNLLNALAGGSVIALADVIRAGTYDDNAMADFIERGEQPLNVSINLLCIRAVEFIGALVGTPEQRDEMEGATSGNNIPFTEFYERLFAIATGWLGWSPNEAWAATPQEVLAAYRGHMDRLKAIHGSKEDDKGNSTDLTKERLNPATRNRLNHLGDMTKHTLP